VAETFPGSLAGKRIVITRSAAQSEAIGRELSARGAIPVMLPLVAFADPDDFAPLDAAIAQIEQFDWIIFTSAQAVRAVMKRSNGPKKPLIRMGSKALVASVGPVTAEAARHAGFPVEYVAETHTGAALAEELGKRLEGTRVFLPRSDRANPDLPAALKRYGAAVTEVIAYRTLRPTEVDQRNLRQVADAEADAVLLFSPLAVQNFAELFGGEQLRVMQDKLSIMAVGPITAKALYEAGVARVVMAGDTTAAAVVEALELHFMNAVKQAPAGAKRA
jgi:uroporphyrinogen III methyltransferase/synthase